MHNERVEREGRRKNRTEAGLSSRKTFLGVATAFQAFHMGGHGMLGQGGGGLESIAIFWGGGEAGIAERKRSVPEGTKGHGRLDYDRLSSCSRENGRMKKRHL